MSPGEKRHLDILFRQQERQGSQPPHITLQGRARLESQRKRKTTKGVAVLRTLNDNKSNDDKAVDPVGTAASLDHLEETILYIESSPTSTPKRSPVSKKVRRRLRKKSQAVVKENVACAEGVEEHIDVHEDVEEIPIAATECIEETFANVEVEESREAINEKVVKPETEVFEIRETESEVGKQDMEMLEVREANTTQVVKPEMGILEVRVADFADSEASIARSCSLSAAAPVR